ncbi:hypothetical protein [uncultured Selenomonas sp.]|uniref:hypothetical protein n=1 Tax=uncultured Selenomonas sp. TaxID=159275 RepID=UPI0025D21C35|nr:hypothetical protein [uncultured Selenomonas sp.]
MKTWFFALVFACAVGMGFAFFADDAADSIGALPFVAHEEKTAGIDVQAAGDVPAAHMDDIRQAVQLFTEDMTANGAPLHHDVHVYVAATQADYVRVIAEQFDQSADEAQAIAQVSGGWTGGRRGLTALNGAAGVMKTASDRQSTTAHELFHQLQYELSDGNDTGASSIFWLEEGTADYIGARIAEKANGKTLRKWSLDTLDDLRLAESTVKPDSIVHCTMEQRMKLMDKSYHTYQMADAMTLCLMEQQRGKEVASILKYFRMLKENKDGEAAFEQAFGMKHAAFLRHFRAWYEREMKRSIELTFSARAGVSDGLAPSMNQYVKTAAARVRQSFGAVPHGRYDVVLCANEQDFAAAIAEHCAVAPEEAAKLADGNLWIENGSTIVFQVAQLEDARQQEYAMAMLLARLLRIQTAGRPEEHPDAKLDGEIETFLDHYATSLSLRRIR